MSYPKLTPVVATDSTEPRYLQDRFADVVNVKDYGAKGDSITDDTAAIQAALNAGRGPVFFPSGIYCVSSEIVVPDGSGIIGTDPFWKFRKTFQYSTGVTVIKYIGSGGANTCVVRFSEKAVGVQGTDFSVDDLINVVGCKFHVDANGTADIGVYVYRAGNMSLLEDITVERAKKYNHVHLGCYAAFFGHFGSYESEELGVAVGWDIFNWGTVECLCFAYSASFHLRNNGTNQTYVSGGDHDLDGAGGKFNVGRGSHVHIVSEGNYGRACILSTKNSADWTSGSLYYYLDYIESNKDGPYIEYFPGSDGMVLQGGFIHPGNGSTLLPQNIKIAAKDNDGSELTNGGPSRYSEWLKITRLSGYGEDQGGNSYNISIDSNTFKYRVEDCDNTLTFPSKAPAVFGNAVSAAVCFTAKTTPSVYYSINGTLERNGAGSYVFTFTQPFKTAGACIPQLSVIVDDGSPYDTQVRLSNLSASAATIKVYNGSGTQTDTNDRISLSFIGELS